MPEEPETRDDTPRAPRWGAAVLGVLALVLVAVAVTSTTSGPPAAERERDPLELADEGELSRVVQAVSGVIRAREDEAEGAAIAALEGLRPQSPGAADLRDACVSVYRGTREAERLTREFRALAPADGGPVPPESRARLEEIYTRTRRYISEANETRDRCLALYQAAARRLHVEPARRDGPAR